MRSKLNITNSSDLFYEVLYRVREDMRVALFTEQDTLVKSCQEKLRNNRPVASIWSDFGNTLLHGVRNKVINIQQHEKDEELR